MKRHFFSSSIATFLLGLWLPTTPLQASEIPWTDSSYYQYAQDQNLADLIRDFTAIQGIDVVISPSVTGTVNGIFENIPPQDFWNNLAKVYNLIWFYDGNILYVYSGSEIQTQIINMTLNESRTIQKIIGELDFASSSISMRYLPDSKMLVVSGSPKFMEILHTFVEKVQQNVFQNLVDETVVQVFPLKYAFAYDVSLNLDTDGGGITVEGVATLLQRVLNGINTVPQTVNQAVGLKSPSSVTSMEGVLQKNGNQNLEKTVSNINNPSVQQQISQLAGLQKDNGDKEENVPGNNPVNQNVAPITSITYDARLNAVIIRDRKDLMPFYQSLIERFDVPTKAIEIQVAIVDIDVGKSRNLGLDIVQFLNGDKELTWRVLGGDDDIDNENTNFFGKFTNVIDGYDMLSRVKALESASAAKTLSRPSLLTLDNIAAVIARTNQNYVQVEGSFSSDLFTISASIALRVIPHIVEIENPDGTVDHKFKLFVNIEDGAINSTGGSQGLPSVSSSQINTQSVLNEGQSLVVGGYYYETHSSSKSGIPILKNIPLIGRAFSQTNRQHQTFQRLFIISPKIVELSADQPDPYKKFFQHGNLSGEAQLSLEKFTVDLPKE